MNFGKMPNKKCYSKFTVAGLTTKLFSLISALLLSYHPSLVVSNFSRIPSPILGPATLLVAVIGATFAYFTVTIKGNPTAPNVTVQSKTLGVIEFETLNQINPLLTLF